MKLLVLKHKTLVEFPGYRAARQGSFLFDTNVEDATFHCLQ